MPDAVGSRLGRPWDCFEERSLDVGESELVLAECLSCAALVRMKARMLHLVWHELQSQRGRPGSKT